MLSRSAGYALRAVIHIAEHQQDGPVRVHEIARALDLPQNYLSKLLNQLARARVLRSVRGKLGGFQLTAAPERLTLHAVSRHFDDLEARRCLLGRPNCTDRTACAAHEHWKAVAVQVTTFLRETSVADLMAHRAALPA